MTTPSQSKMPSGVKVNTFGQFPSKKVSEFRMNSETFFDIDQLWTIRSRGIAAVVLYVICARVIFVVQHEAQVE
jgi:hypothetical protein